MQLAISNKLHSVPRNEDSWVQVQNIVLCGEHMSDLVQAYTETRTQTSSEVNGCGKTTTMTAEPSVA